MGCTESAPNMQAERKEDLKIMAKPIFKDDEWKFTKLANKVTVANLHSCRLEKFTDTDEGNEWLCNGIEIFAKGCRGGHQEGDFQLHEDQAGFACDKEECDFDICEMCIRWALYAQSNKEVDLGLSDGFEKDAVQKPEDDPTPQ